MYEFLVLARLSRLPMHGYLIAKIIGDIMGPFRCLQWGALYPLLTRLEQEGLITAVQEYPAPEGGRPRKVYAITEAGRQRLHEHLMDTEKHQSEYDTVFAHKVALFSQLTPEERLQISRHYSVYAQRNLDHLRHERRDLLDNVSSVLSEEQLRDIVAVMDHRIEYWERERAWAEELITRQYQKESV
jgi:DNA-binding PadR family transcriptional regulator